MARIVNLDASVDEAKQIVRQIRDDGTKAEDDRYSALEQVKDEIQKLMDELDELGKD